MKETSHGINGARRQKPAVVHSTDEGGIVSEPAKLS